jgi:hypothetical protein
MKIVCATLSFAFSITAFADYNQLSREQAAQAEAQREADAQARAITNRDEHNARLRAAADAFARNHGGASSMSEQVSESSGYRSSTPGYISRIEFTLRDRAGDDCVASESFWGFWNNNRGPRVYVSCKYKDANGTVQNGPSSESAGRSLAHHHHRKHK